MTGRLIAHLDIDAFYASVELQRRPELAGLPVIVSGGGPRAVVTTASYEARKFGIHSAMPTARARRLCPDAVLVPPDFGAYREASGQVWAIIRSHFDGVEQAGLDEGYIDLSGMLAPKAPVRRVLTEVRSTTGLSISVGIGPNKLVAKVASDCEKPEGFVVLDRESACERFASSPPRLIPGIGPKTAAKLEAAGIATIGDLRQVPEDELIARFGPSHGTMLHRRSRFQDDSPVVLERIAVSRSSETTFDSDVSDRDELFRVIARLSEDVCSAQRSRERPGKTIGIKIRLSDFTTVTRARTLERPTHDTALVTRVANELLAAYDPPLPVRLLGVRLAGFDEATATAEDEGSQLRLSVA